MIEDVGHAVGRLVEIDRNGDGAGPGYGEIGGVPLGAIGGKETHAIAGLYAEFHKGHGQAGYPAEQLRGRDGLPEIVAAKHLGARVGEYVDDVEKAGREGAVGHFRYRVFARQVSLTLL